MPSIRFRPLLLALAALLASGLALATPIGQPWYSIEINPWDETFETPASARVFRSTPDDVDNGMLAAGVTLGPYVLPPRQADLSAVVINDGQTFWADASSPFYTGLPRPPGAFIGGDVSVDVVQSFRRDGEVARFGFTYTQGLLEIFRDVEMGRPCDGCIRAEVGWEATVTLNSDPTTILWRESQFASLWDDNGTLTLDVFGFSLDAPVNPLWRWDCARCGGPVRALSQAVLDGPYTGMVDLSGIPFDSSLPADQQPEFTVHVTLTALAFDEGVWSGARAFARDPLGDDGGVLLAIAGLTPTNNPVGVVPEPGMWAMMLAGLAVTAGFARRRRAAA